MSAERMDERVEALGSTGEGRLRTTFEHALAGALAEARCETLCDGLSLRLFRRLAEGRPVPLERLAADLSLPLEVVEAGVRRLPNVEFDPEGRVVGHGITLVPTPHRFFTGGRALYTWCAWDTLTFPALLGQPARAESPCRATGSTVRVAVGLDGIEAVEPEDAVISMVLPDRESVRCDVRGAFCDHVHFYRSPEAAAGWLEDVPDGSILSVVDAYALGRRVERMCRGADGDARAMECECSRRSSGEGAAR